MADQRPFNERDYPVIVGIDFGMENEDQEPKLCNFYSTSLIFNQEDIEDIVRWPRQSSSVYCKTPTMNLYRGDSKKMVQWGNAARLELLRPINRDAVLLKQYKLYLDEALSKDLVPLPNGLTIVDVISDFLREFHDHLLFEMSRGIAREFKQDSFRYCLTVPAMWSDRAKALMRESAIIAGLIKETDHRDRLMLISEPEAAAIYCEKKCDQFNLKSGDKFMICDAGGGTVDLIVFEVEATFQGTRKFKEDTKGHGESCGSIFIDKRMRKLLKKKLKSATKSVPPYAFEHMMDSFINTVKPEFDGTDDHFIQLPASLELSSLTNEEIGLDEGVLCLTMQELRDDVFEPVVQDVLNLIREQKKTVSRLEAIFLVGGFGSSNYLFKRVQQEFGHEVPLIAVPPRAELAVTRGAVFFGKNPNLVTTRVPRYWYGIDSTNKFIEGVDPPEFRIVRADGSVRADNRFSVFVRRGEPLDINDCVVKKYYAFYPNQTVCSLFAADTEEEPRYTCAPTLGVRRIANFTIPMPKLQDVQYGEKIDLLIKMYFGEVELRVEAVIQGKTYSTTCMFEA
ncbi:hypothetical protein Unana1_04335 [Umbelopsis nana]